MKILERFFPYIPHNFFTLPHYPYLSEIPLIMTENFLPMVAATSGSGTCFSQFPIAEMWWRKGLGHLRELLGGVRSHSQLFCIPRQYPHPGPFFLVIWNSSKYYTQSYSYWAIKPVVQIDLKQVETRKSLYFLLTQRGLRFSELYRCD